MARGGSGESGRKVKGHEGHCAARVAWSRAREDRVGVGLRRGLWGAWPQGPRGRAGSCRREAGKASPRGCSISIFASKPQAG